MSDAAALNTCGACEGIRPLTPARVHNPPGLSALAWRAGTHGQFKETMLAALSGSAALRTLATRDDNDPTIALIDAWAAALDVLTFYQERIANENYLGTATELRSILELARAIGYELAPGVAASTRLAFKLETAVGAPLAATIPAGTKVQSVPGQDEKPQLYESTDELAARAAWNEMPVRTRKPWWNGRPHTVIYLQGVAYDLRPGDPLLFVEADSAEPPQFRRVGSARLYPTDPAKQDATAVTLDQSISIKTRPRIYLLRQRAALFGHNAPDIRLMSDDVRAALGNTGEKNARQWANFNLAYSDQSQPDEGELVREISLDAVYPNLAPGNWIYLHAQIARAANRKTARVRASTSPLTNLGAAVAAPPAGIATEYVGVPAIDGEPKKTGHRTLEHAYQVEEVRETSLSWFAISGKATQLRVAADAFNDFWDALRETAVYLTTAELTPGEAPVADPIAAGDKSLPLDVLLPSDDALAAGRLLLVTGADPTTREVQAEAVTLESTSVTAAGDSRKLTVLHLASGLLHSYARDSMRVRGNVAAATHGETKQETLGSGDAAAVFQKFTLKSRPLTYVSSAIAPGGRLSTLEVRVGGVRWTEVPSFFGRSPDEHIYITRRSDAGVVTVQFGDGRTGARLPTGVENITAKYRAGIGAEGEVNAEQLSQLLSRPLGVKEVVNPQPGAGAQDPEQLVDARAHAPLTVLTLDRVVSLRDYEDFARSYAGIGKAAAAWLQMGEHPRVHLTVALADQSSPPADAPTLENLAGALDLARHALHPVIIQGYRERAFVVRAKLKVDPDYAADAVIANATTALTEWFAFASRQFAQEVTAAEIIAVIQGVDGVVYVDVNKLAFDDGEEAKNGWLRADPGRVDRDGEVQPADLLTLAAENIHLAPIES